MQRTFSIIKPDAFRKGYSAAMLAEIDKAGFKIVALKKMFLSKSQAQGSMLSMPSGLSSIR